MRARLAFALVPMIVATVGATGPPDGLAGLIDGADRLVVLESPDQGAAVLFRSSDRRDLDALKAAARVGEPDSPVHCMCDGTPAIFLYAGEREVGRISNHHGQLIRSNLWRTDKPPADPEAFLKWFDDRGIVGPRREVVAARARREEAEKVGRKWLDSMPPALRPLWPSLQAPIGNDLTPMRVALAAKVPGPADRIRALFRWYGSGAGPWSGFPSYEDVAEKMLLEYPTRDLLAAIEGQDLDEAETEGVARLFGGWRFSQLRRGDGALLPAGLKARLLAHSLASPDEDKQGRARRAFGRE